MRRLALWGLLAWLSACTCDSRRCNPSNCETCCSAEDTCVLGGPPSRCGLAGADCVDCGTGQCVNGSCSSQVCTGTSCPANLVCDLDGGTCIARPACALDGGCPAGLLCVRELKLCSTRCAGGADCPDSAKNCSFNTSRCSSDAICRAGQSDAGALSCDPAGKLCR